MIDTHDMNAGAAVAAVRDLDDSDQLRETLEHERLHPTYDNGRKQVVDAIEERIGELATADIEEATPSPRAPRKGGSYVAGELTERTAPRRAPEEGKS